MEDVEDREAELDVKEEVGVEDEENEGDAEDEEDANIEFHFGRLVHDLSLVST